MAILVAMTKKGVILLGGSFIHRMLYLFRPFDKSTRCVPIMATSTEYESRWHTPGGAIIATGENNFAITLQMFCNGFFEFFLTIPRLIHVPVYGWLAEWKPVLPLARTR